MTKSSRRRPALPRCAFPFRSTMRMRHPRESRRRVKLRVPRASPPRDGSWPEPETTGTGFPCVFYLKYDMYRNNWPLMALAHYATAIGALKRE